MVFAAARRADSCDSEGIVGRREACPASCRNRPRELCVAHRFDLAADVAHQMDVASARLAGLGKLIAVSPTLHYEAPDDAAIGE